LATAAFLFFWLREFTIAHLALAIMSAVMTAIYVLPAAILETPDSWAAALILLAFWCASRNRLMGAVAVAVVAILVRPDAILALGALCAYTTWRGQWRVALAGGITGAGIYLVATAGAYPWSTLFYHAFVSPLLHPAEFESPLGPADYLVVYIERIASWPSRNPIFPGAIALGVLVAAMRFKRAGWRDPYAVIVVLVLGCMTAHWIVFPAAMTRHQMPYYIVIAVALAFHFAEAFADQRRHKAAASFERE
jgi:hypothetical protein